MNCDVQMLGSWIFWVLTNDRISCDSVPEVESGEFPVALRRDKDVVRIDAGMIRFGARVQKGQRLADLTRERARPTPG